MKRLGWIVRLSVIVVLVTISIEAKKIPQADLRLRSYDASSIIGRSATMVEFGGYSTPKCRLALSDDGRLFYLTKVHSTCRKLTNRNGIRIICNSNKSVCKTRSELSAFVTGGSDTTSSDSPRPSWCSASRLNRTERTICSHDTLASLDLKLARVYGSQRSRSNDRAQGYWLRHRRNACGSDVSCLARAYRERIEELEGDGRKYSNASVASNQYSETAREDKPQHSNPSYSNGYEVGSCVYIEGKMAFFIHVKIKGYIESKSGDRIQIRIADTEGQSPRYKGVSLYQGAIIWDNKYNWNLCD